MELHPIMYVADQYAERDFYARFGFETSYEGEEFPGFLALEQGRATFGLQAASESNVAYQRGLRWQFEVQAAGELDTIIQTCEELGIHYEVVTETGGERFHHRIVKVVSPAGHDVWFEGPEGE